MDVYTVKQRTGKPGLIFFGAFGRPAAFEGRIAEVAAAAGVHGGNQLKFGGINRVGIDARNSYIAVFQRLAQGFQRGAAEFWQFIQKQDAVVCERNFSGAALRPPPTKAGVEAE